MFEQEKKLR